MLQEAKTRRWGDSVSFPVVEFGTAAHMRQVREKLCVGKTHTSANCLNSDKPAFKSLKCTAGRPKQTVDGEGASVFGYSSLQRKRDHSQEVVHVSAINGPLSVLVFRKDVGLHVASSGKMTCCLHVSHGLYWGGGRVTLDK